MSRKVCVITTVHPPFDPRVFERGARSLRRAGYDVVLIAPHPRDEERDGVRILGLRRSRSRCVRILTGGWRAFFRALRIRADVYHFHDPEFMPFGVLLQLLRRRPVIYDAHEDYPQHMRSKGWIPAPARRLASRLVLFVEWVTCRTVACTITPTPTLTERFVRMGARRAETVLNLPSADFLRTEEDADLPDPVDVIHVGSLSASRLEFLLDVAARVSTEHPHSRWAIVGIHDAALPQVETLVAARGLVDRVRIIGKVSHERIGEYLRVSRLGVNHHPRERRFDVAIPVKVFEYMAAGLPVVSSELPLLRQLAGDDAIVYVDPGNRDAFATAISSVLATPELAGRLGREGGRLARERLNWACEEPHFLKIYEELIG